MLVLFVELDLVCPDMTGVCEVGSNGARAFDVHNVSGDGTVKI